jgi:SAM-dependent methyltransferase
MTGQEDWLVLARDGSPDDIRERILTGYKSGKPFTPYVPTVPLPAVQSALDFGCGLGRNFPYLKQLARTVAGYDLPPMVERCRQSGGVAIDFLSSDWQQMKSLKFDLIVCSLVLQHIEPEPVRLFLRDFTLMAPSIYLLTRATTDFGEQMLDVIAETGLFDGGDCVEVDHHPITHQLTALGTLSFVEARGRQHGHFEVMLRVKSGA